MVDMNERSHKNRVTRPPRGRAFQDIVIQSFQCKLAQTVFFFHIFIFGFVRIKTKVL